MQKLVVDKGRDKGMSVIVSPKSKVIVGRDRQANLQLTDGLASRRHFSLSFQDERYVLEDLGSSRWVATDVADKKAVTVLSSRGDDFALRWKLRLEGGPGWIDWPGGRIELKAEEGQEEISIFLCRAGERLFLDVRGRARAETSVEAGERKLLYVSTVNGGSARLTVLSAEELLTGK